MKILKYHGIFENISFVEMESYNHSSSNGIPKSFIEMES